MLFMNISEYADYLSHEDFDYNLILPNYYMSYLNIYKI